MRVHGYAWDSKRSQNVVQTVRTFRKSRDRNRTPFWAGNSLFSSSERVPAKVQNHGFQIENALFRFYPVLASIFGPQGLDFGTALGENTTKMDHETGFENLSCFDTCFNRFWDHF